MSQEQSLPGTYYGPAVPPPQVKNSRESFFSRYRNWFLYAAVGLLFALGFIALLMWQLFRPAYVRGYVSQASLTQFNLTIVPGGNNLAYNLRTTILIQNPNRRDGIYYDQIDAIASYRDKIFGSVRLPSFHQRRRTTIAVQPVFSGQSAIVLNSADLQEFDKQKKARVYDVTVLLRVGTKTLARLRT